MKEGAAGGDCFPDRIQFLALFLFTDIAWTYYDSPLNAASISASSRLECSNEYLQCHYWAEALGNAMGVRLLGSEPSYSACVYLSESLEQVTGLKRHDIWSTLRRRYRRPDLSLNQTSL
jgi:hypothetical protein